MITLGRRSFAGPFLLPLWSAPRAPGLFAVMVPGWRLLTFRALHFGETEGFSIGKIKAHPRYAEWMSVAGTDWNLYVATVEMPLATPGERHAAERDVIREYRPEFSAPVPNPELPGLRTLLLHRAMRAGAQE
jgi:hypothetical protein